jgi:hypothetical protein
MNGLLGTWLWLSSVLWGHSGSELTITWFCGGFILVLAILDRRLPAGWLVSATLGAWVAGSAFFLATWNQATEWNNLLVGVAVLVFSLRSGVSPRQPRGR